MADTQRFTRQIRLPEVGEAGQDRILRAELVLDEHPGLALERDYLERAGVKHLTVRPQPPTRAFSHAEAFRFGAARAVAEGAWRSLEALRTVLGVSSV